VAGRRSEVLRDHFGGAADFRGADMRQVNLAGAYPEGAMMPAMTAAVDAHLNGAAELGKGRGEREAQKEMER
jgi:hypothetical protein